MKKNKKKTENIRYNGRNAFGERCIAKFLVLEKETAMQQFLEALADIDAHKGKRIEYTFQLGKTFTHEEADAFRLQMDRITAFRARTQSRPYFSFNRSTSSFPLTV